MQSYPKGRYVDDARGWVAYLHRRGGQRAEALAEYYKMLGHPTSWRVRLEAKQSLQMLGHHYDDETLERVEQLLAGDVNGAMAYAYHRIYNHAVDFTYQEVYTWRFSDEDGSGRHKEIERVDKLRGLGNHELERVAKFATEMIERHPKAAYSSGFMLRLAEAELESANFEQSERFATKALALGIQGDLRAQALWVKGSSEHKLKRLMAAEKTFAELVAKFPDSKYVEGARRLLAMIAEDRGDLESALEIYFALNYKTDVAYFLDVLFPTERLAKFIESHRSHREYNRMLYGLGLRYMREKRWTDARAVLNNVQTEKGVDYYLNSPVEATWHFAKEPEYEDEKLTMIKSSWVLQDLKTIDTLEHYEKAVEIADADAKPEAMYQLASAYYEADDLAFYNPAAWRGTRVGAISQVQFSDHERAANESQTILEHMRAHDPMAHAIPIYEEIVARFPDTKVARDAMYSIAVAHERLANRNRTWSAAYLRGLFPGPRKITYAEVRRTYPNYQLPRGTDGWQPSTRTVNGGPGWAAPPKPLPRETKEQRIKRLLREAATTTASNYSNKVLPKVKKKVGEGIDWYKSAIEAAVYGIFSGICLSVLIFIGIGLHPRTRSPETITEIDDHKAADSRVDKFLG
jgi:outer membrane protein assembly factor BamD (BamD/ComL family)